MEKLGQGGMGAVYLARQVSLGRVVALKVLPETAQDDPDAVSRFEREAKVAASLAHGNLVRVYGSGNADGCHYIAMELVQGENLHERLKRGPLPIPEALRVCAEVARGLQCGWERAQLIHRDIKPSNIYLSNEGEVKLGDLGLAKSLRSDTTGLTQTGMMMGTPHYISPEQARAEKNLDFRADIYSLGCTLFHCITGRTPYSADDALTLMTQHLNAPPPALLKAMPQAPLPLARLVGRMLKKSRHERHGSYEELIADLEHVREQIESGALNAGPSVLVQAWKGVAESGTPGSGANPVQPAASSRGNSALLWGAIGAGILVLGGLAVALFSTPAKRTKARATVPAVAEKAEPVLAASNATSMPRWQNVFTEPGLLRLRDGAALVNGELSLPPRASLYIQTPGNPPRDGAIRAKLTYGGGHTNLKVRMNSTGSYGLNFEARGTVRLFYWDQASQSSSNIRIFEPEVPLEQGRKYELELRAMGSTLQVSLDGRVLGTATDSRLVDGFFGVALAKNVDDLPAIIHSLEIQGDDAAAGENEPASAPR